MQQEIDPPSRRGERDAVRVLVVARVRLYRDGIVTALERDGRFVVVGSSGEMPAEISAHALGRPDVVVLDLGVAGPSLVRELGAVLPGLRVVALAVAETDEAVVRWAEAGAAALVGDEGDVADLVAAVAAAACDEGTCTPRMTAALLRRVREAATAPDAAGDAGLTARETEIALLLEEGLSNKEIATRLHIEVPTVKNHVHRILDKLGVTRRAEAGARMRRAPAGARD